MLRAASSGSFSDWDLVEGDVSGLEEALFEPTAFAAEARRWLSSAWLDPARRPPLARDDLAQLVARLHEAEQAHWTDLQTRLARRWQRLHFS